MLLNKIKLLIKVEILLNYYKCHFVAIFLKYTMVKLLTLTIHFFFLNVHLKKNKTLMVLKDFTVWLL